MHNNKYYLNFMFDNQPQSSDFSHRQSPPLSDNIDSLKDSVLSLTHRMNQLEVLLNKKMDRNQCLAITQKKASSSQLKQYISELQSKMRQQMRMDEQRTNKMQQIAIDKINQLSQKLNSNRTGNQSKNSLKTRPKQRKLKAQQLFIQSSQTMFSLLIDQIGKLQDKNEFLQKQIEGRNQKTINLHNEVCRKIDKLETQIQDKNKNSSHGLENNYLSSSWSQVQRCNKPTVHKSPAQTSNFQSLRIDLLNKTIQTLQQDLLAKINIKDVLAVIQQEMKPLEASLNQVKEYVQESIENTKNILANQTEINKQICQGLKMGWWHIYEQQNQFAIFNKQLLNLVPEIYHYEPGQASQNYITITQSGIYLIKIHSLNSHSSQNIFSQGPSLVNASSQFELMFGTEVHTIKHESAFRIKKNTQLRIIMRQSQQIVVSLIKL